MSCLFQFGAAVAAVELGDVTRFLLISLSDIASSSEEDESDQVVMVVFVFVVVLFVVVISWGNKYCEWVGTHLCVCVSPFWRCVVGKSCSCERKRDIWRST